MKKVLLTSTALVMTAGVAAAEMTMSASATLTYGNFGTGNFRSGYTVPTAGEVAANPGVAAAIPGAAYTAATALTNAQGDFTAADLTAGTAARTLEAAKAASTAATENAAYLGAVLSSNAANTAAPNSSWSSEADLDIAGSGGGGNVTYSATLELDESGEAAGAFTMATGGLTFVYDANDVGTLVTTGADGEDDSTGDYMVSYAAGGLSASYEQDTTSEDTEIKVGYATGDLTVGLTLDVT